MASTCCTTLLFPPSTAAPGRLPTDMSVNGEAAQRLRDFVGRGNRWCSPPAQSCGAATPRRKPRAPLVNWKRPNLLRASQTESMAAAAAAAAAWYLTGPGRPAAGPGRPAAGPGLSVSRWRRTRTATRRARRRRRVCVWGRQRVCVGRERGRERARERERDGEGEGEGEGDGVGERARKRDRDREV